MSPVARFGSAAGIALLSSWLAARAAMVVVPPEREAWSVVAVGVNTDVLLARLSVGNTGFYADQLSTRLLLLRQAGQTLEHHAMYGPTTLRADGVASGPDALVSTAGAWTLRIGGDAAQVRARIDGAATECPPTAGDLTGTLGTSPAGTTTAFEGGEILRGTAVVVRTRAVGRIEEQALYVLGNGVALGIDPRSDCPAWARIGSQTWSGEAPPLSGRETGRASLGPWEVTWRGTAAARDTDAMGHVSAWERLLALAVGWPAPTLKAIRVGVRIRGQGFDEPRTGVLLVRGTSLL
jgi:hypothetical protein